VGVRRLLFFGLVCLLAACSRKSEAPSGVDASAPAPSTVVIEAAAPPTTVKKSDAAPEASAPTSSFDAGVNACKLVYGPVEQPWTGDAALLAVDGAIELITHNGGVPSVTRLPLPPLDAPLGKVTIDTEREHVSSPPCAAAGNDIFCMDAQGAVTRTPRGAPLGTVVAKARPGSRLAAATLAGSHALVAYIAERKTSEMMVSEAFASVDGAPPVRISEEGSGATVVTLAPRGSRVVAMLLDGRAAMTPVHARALAWKDGQLDVGPDAVVFVGGGAERQTSGVLAMGPAGSAFALVPVAGESGFGMAAVHVGDPPVTDEKAVWSEYPNGLDPAPIAATVGVSPIRVARVRPVTAKPDSARGVELGKLDDAGAFTPYGMISTTGRVTSLEVATDSAHSLWIYYTDAAGSWLERRACP
jgi:hypothetical protein